MDNKLSGFLFNKIGIPNYQRFLDLTSIRHKLIAGNVANVSTPGYRAQDIDFKSELAKSTNNQKNLAGRVTHAHHIPLGQHKGRPPDVEQQKVTDGELNSVDIDREISKMARNELLFTISARLLERKFSGLRKAITSK